MTPDDIVTALRMDRRLARPTRAQRARRVLARLVEDLVGLALSVWTVTLLLGAWHSLRPAVPPAGAVEVLVALVTLRSVALSVATTITRSVRSTLDDST